MSILKLDATMLLCITVWRLYHLIATVASLSLQVDILSTVQDHQLTDFAMGAYVVIWLMVYPGELCIFRAFRKEHAQVC